MQVQKISPVSFGMIKPIMKDGKSDIKNNVSFGYKSELKTLFRDGKLPSVKFDIFGAELTPKNATIDHIIPKSKGGPNALYNYTLATDYWNHLRGNKPLSGFLTKENLDRYISQFVDVVVDTFNGNEYIKGILKTIEKAGKMGV